MAEMSPKRWRELVGEPVELRRRDVGHRNPARAAEIAEVAESVWRQIESGKKTRSAGVVVAPNPSAETRARVCRALGWTDNSIDKLLRGEKAVERPGWKQPPPPPAPAAKPAKSAESAEVAELAAQVEALTAVVAELKAIIPNIRRGSRAVKGRQTGS